MRAIPGNYPLAARAAAPGLSPLERSLSLFAPVRRGEGRGAVLLATNVFLLLVAYYLLKPLREVLVLTEVGAEIRSMAAGGQALALFILMPLYAAWSRGRNRLRLIQGVTLFFVSHLAVFALLGMAGVPVGLAFYLWIGVFNVFVVAQFWAFAAELYRVESGQRLFALIMAGATLGGFTGSQVYGQLAGPLGPWGMMGLAGFALLATLGLMSRAARSVPPSSARDAECARRVVEDRSCGFKAVVSDGYLRLIALFVVLLNLIQTTGEYVMAKMVLSHAYDAVEAGRAASQEAVIGAFFSDFYGWMAVLTFAVQLLLVSRVIRTAGVSGALLLMPLVAAVGYGLIAFVPLFSLVALVQLTGTSLNHSVRNTAQQALFLPVDGTARFQGKTAIDTFFWRVGDLLAAAAVGAGIYVFRFGTFEFAFFNAVLALVWIVTALLIGRRYRALLQKEAST